MTDDALTPDGRVLAGRYRLGEVLGTGGMSTVYRAYDVSLGRNVAVKVLRSLDGDPSVGRRERSEIKMLASFNHHSLVTLFDADVSAIGGVEQTFLVMELVDGQTLARRFTAGALSPEETAAWTTDILEALHVIHARGVIHRDLKPGNILLSDSLVPGKTFRAKLADFGIAAVLGATRITSTGGVIGTAAYLSPEQALGLEVGPASDIYSLGLVILESLTGARAFEGSLMETLGARLTRDPEIPSIVDPDWRARITAMTQRNPESRPSAEDLLHTLITPQGVVGPVPAPQRTLPPEDLMSTRVLLPADATTRVLPADDATRLLAATAGGPGSSDPTPGSPALGEPASAVTATAPTRIARSSVSIFDDETLPVSAAAAPIVRRRRFGMLALVVAVIGVIAAGLIAFINPTATPVSVTPTGSARPTPAAPVASLPAVTVPVAPIPTEPADDEKKGEGDERGKGNNQDKKP